MQHRYVALILFACTFATLSPLRTTATSLPPVVLSEINWGGSALSTADEWIELANTTSHEIAIGSWRITGASAETSPLIIPENTLLSAGGTYLIANYSDTNEKSVLEHAPQLVTSTVSIPNTSLALTLYDRDGLVIDTYTDAGTPDFGSSSPSASMKRDLHDGTWVDMELPQDDVLTILPCSSIPVPVDAPEEREEDVQSASAVAEVTLIAPVLAEIVQESVIAEPVSPNPSPDIHTNDVDEDVVVVPETASTRTIDYQALRVTEFVSDPSDGKEFIELYNEGLETLPLAGVSLADASGKSTVLSGDLAPGAYLSVDNPLGKLNNDGDRITLLLPDGQTLFTLSYGTDSFPAPKKGFSAGVCADGWLTTLSPSPGQANLCSSSSLSYETQESSTTSVELDRTSSGTLASVQGAVSSSETENFDASDVAPAQSVEVTHAVAETATQASSAAHEQTTLSPASSSSNKKPSKSTPLSVALEDLDTVASGQVVDVTGVIAAAPGMFGKRLAYLDGVQLYFHKALWPDLLVGDAIRLTGTWDFADGNRRIKIADAEDIDVLGNETPVPFAWEEVPPDAVGDVLVWVTATLVGKDGDAFMFALASGEEIPVVDVAKSGALSALRVGEELSLVGMRLPHDGRMVLAPRSADDVVKMPADVSLPAISGAVGTVLGGDTSQGGSSLPPASPAPLIGGSILASGVGALSYWFIRAKKYSFLFSS